MMEQTSQLDGPSLAREDVWADGTIDGQEGAAAVIWP